MGINFNLSKILFDCPLGTLFYFSDIDKYLGYAGFGYVENLGGFIFYFNNYFEVLRKMSCIYYDYTLNNYGSKYIGDKTCIIFPDKENQDWRNFKAPWKDPKYDPKDTIYNMVKLRNPYYCYKMNY